MLKASIRSCLINEAEVFQDASDIRMLEHNSQREIAIVAGRPKSHTDVIPVQLL
jgi:hypothetical protein